MKHKMFKNFKYIFHSLFRKKNRSFVNDRNSQYSKSCHRCTEQKIENFMEDVYQSTYTFNNNSILGLLHIEAKLTTIQPSQLKGLLSYYQLQSNIQIINMSVFYDLSKLFQKLYWGLNSSSSLWLLLTLLMQTSSLAQRSSPETLCW